MRRCLTDPFFYCTGKPVLTTTYVQVGGYDLAGTYHEETAAIEVCKKSPTDCGASLRNSELDAYSQSVV